MPISKARDSGGEFAEYRQLIMHTLERLQAGITAIDVKVDALRNQDVEAMKIDIAMLKMRASIYGGLGGFLGGAIISALITKLMR